MLFEIDGEGGVSRLDDTARMPDGCYTTFRTYGSNRILLLNKHIERLRESAVLQGRDAQLAERRVRAGVAAVLDATPYPESRLRLTFAAPRLVAAVEAFAPLPSQMYEEGARCVTLPLRRENPHAKDTRFQRTAAAAYARLPAGVHEGLLVDPLDQALLEGLSSNFFAVVAGELRTERERVLPGVTRSLVLELAGESLTVRLDAVRRGELSRVTEAFLTSVSRGILPVTSVDGEPVGNGRPGPRSRELSRRLELFGLEHAKPPS